MAWVRGRPLDVGVPSPSLPSAQLLSPAPNQALLWGSQSAATEPAGRGCHARQRAFWKGETTNRAVERQAVEHSNRSPAC
jgi:hypothetical protein